MYCPAAFQENRLPVLHALMAQYPLATIVAHGSSGLVVEHVPLLLRPGPDGHGCLVGHVAMANPLVAPDLLANGAVEVRVVFQGPQIYISPNWYASKQEHGQVVPTWNYAVVHASGQLSRIDDPKWKRGLLEELTRTHEAAQPNPWAVGDAPEPYLQRMMGAIVGLQVRVDGLQGKWKVSQNQPEANRQTVVAGLRSSGSPAQLAMASLVEQAGQR